MKFTFFGFSEIGKSHAQNEDRYFREEKEGLFLPGQIAQITRDHSFVGEQQKSGLLSREEARAHPQRNLLTSALGLGENFQIDLYLADVAPGDLFLLCSDGLHAPLSDEEILTVILCPFKTQPFTR